MTKWRKCPLLLPFPLPLLPFHPTTTTTHLLPLPFPLFLPPPPTHFEHQWNFLSPIRTTPQLKTKIPFFFTSVRILSFVRFLSSSTNAIVFQSNKTKICFCFAAVSLENSIAQMMNSKMNQLNCFSCTWTKGFIEEATGEAICFSRIKSRSSSTSDELKSFVPVRNPVSNPIPNHSFQIAKIDDFILLTISSMKLLLKFCYPNVGRYVVYSFASLEFICSFKLLFK